MHTKYSEQDKNSGEAMQETVSAAIHLSHFLIQNNLREGIIFILKSVLLTNTASNMHMVKFLWYLTSFILE